ncbi:FAD/NAD(P)-binding protein, partial [Pseudomonas viridiflava]
MTASNTSCQILIVGAGAAGISTAASLLARDKNLNITLIDPADTHYY